MLDLIPNGFVLQRTDAPCYSILNYINPSLIMVLLHTALSLSTQLTTFFTTGRLTPCAKRLFLRKLVRMPLFSGRSSVIRSS